MDHLHFMTNPIWMDVLFFACHRAKDGTKGQNFGVLGDYLGG